MNTLVDHHAAFFADNRFHVTLPGGTAFSFPIAGNRRLENATPEQLNNVEVDEDGLHWPDIDEDLSFAGVEHISVDVTAVGETDVLLLDARRLVHTCSNACEFHNRLILNLLGVMAAKNLTMNRKLQITSRRTTREKLLTYLEMQARQAGSASFTIPFDRQALADFLEVDRSGLSAEIGKLRREGLLESERNSFTLLYEKSTD